MLDDEQGLVMIFILLATMISITNVVQMLALPVGMPRSLSIFSVSARKSGESGPALVDVFEMSSPA